jgi:3-methyladenine DNA glycosylase AlkD
MAEEKTIAFDWAFRLKRLYEPDDFAIFELWLDRYVDSWGACDAFCTKAFGEFILQYGQFIPRVKAWTASINRWMRRASAVVMIYPNRRGKYVDDSFDIANHLLKDEDDLVQKGYGWMLKEISNYRIRDVFDFVMKKRALMPRTALRYAVEKMPQVLRDKAMARS